MRQTASVHVSRAIPSGFCRRVSALALTLLLVGTAGASAAPLAACETPARTLPRDIVPVHYRIELAPDLESGTVAGTAFIDVEVREPTPRIVLNALDLTLDAAHVESFGGAASIATDAAAQTAALTFAQPLAPGPQGLHLSFAARVSEFPPGLFTIKYGNAAGAQRMLQAAPIWPVRAVFSHAGTSLHSRRRSRFRCFCRAPMSQSATCPSRTTSPSRLLSKSCPACRSPHL